MASLTVGFAVIVGLVVGSFANVPIHRWPRGGTVTSPKTSACPSCSTPIAPRDNIPVLSWLLLRGRCRHCNNPIHWRYPFVEATTAVLFGATAAVHDGSWLLPALLVMMWTCVVATAIDLEFRIIPNRMTYPLFPLTIALVTVAAVGDDAWIDWRRAMIAGIAVPAGMLGFSLLFELLRGKQGIGMGDIKWAPALAMPLAYLSGWHLLVWFYGTIFSGGIIAIGLVAAKKAKMASRIPYGPYMAVGAVLATLAGYPLGDWLEMRLLGT